MSEMSEPTSADTQVITARVDVVETPPEASVLAVDDEDDDDVAAAVVPPPEFMASPSGLVEEYDEGELERKNALFSFMADFPWPFLVIIPLVFALLIGFGWTTEEKIEQSVEDLWIAQDGDYAQSKAYAAKYGFDKSPISTFTAMSLSRDEGNLLTAERLEEIRSRMEATERVVVEHKGNNYTWDDICFMSMDPYRFPCLRLSPMDLYKEARWYFDEIDRLTFYDTVKGGLVPLLPRFGVLRSTCTEACADEIAYRTNPESDGYDPFALLADVMSWEYNTPCRICIEESYTAMIKNIHASIPENFLYLQTQVKIAQDNLEEGSDEWRELNDIYNNLGLLSTSVSTDDVVDFYAYYMLRSMYAEMGAEELVRQYALNAEAVAGCQVAAGFFGWVCPPDPSDVDAVMTKKWLLDHTDNVFSSITTAGAPFPFWSEGDGTGVLFVPNEETGMLFPVSGSGVNMSAPMDSLRTYFSYLYFGRQVDLSSRQWKDLVEANPVYAWFMASVTPAPEGTVCGNGNLTGTVTGDANIDAESAAGLAAMTPRWCTNYSIPNTENAGTGNYTKQYFARMWYDLLFDSFMNITQGEDDPYSWTSGTGCDYVSGGERYSYTNQTEKDILSNSSRLVYNIDEGASLGAVDVHMLLGGAEPPIGEYSFENPLIRSNIMQTLYVATVGEGIVTRVKNCHRPGGPVNITVEDANSILQKMKELMENTWNEGWNDEDSSDVQFLSFFDDYGDALGTAGRVMEDITLDSSLLMTISIIAIAVFSVLFLISGDAIDSRILITLIGVGLVVLSFFAGVGLGLLVNIKINVAIAWTLPFVIIGLGVDDVYIVLIAIKKQGGYTKKHFLKAMREVVVPVSMTSLVNASMFAVLNLSDIPIIYLTSRVACFCVIGLYLSVVFCFPAYCYLDMKRQAAGRMDVLVCLQGSSKPAATSSDIRSTILYDRFFKPIVLGSNDRIRSFVHLMIFAISITLFSVGAWGVTQRDIGLNVSEFLPADRPGHHYIKSFGDLAAQPINMNWGALEYNDTDTQMKMIKQFEDLAKLPYVVDGNSKQVWMAEFALWTSRHCTENFGRENFDQGRCGRDQLYIDTATNETSYCAGTWVPNKFRLRNKLFQTASDETCAVTEGGVCRPIEQMHPDDLEEIDALSNPFADSYCPVVYDWTPEKWQFCLKQWRSLAATAAAHTFLLEGSGTPTECSGVYKLDEDFVWPMPYSSGPVLYVIEAEYTTTVTDIEGTLNFMKETRSICDDDPELQCWMSGNVYDFFTQYEGIFEVLVELAIYATAAGFGISFIFLFCRLLWDNNHSVCKLFWGSLVGSLLIVVTIVMSLVTVTGVSILCGVNLTAFSNMSFVLSVGFAVEYSVHIVARWMRANMALKTSRDRVHYTMSFLMVPTFMSFVSSTIGVCCLAFTEFEFNKIYFFRPLMIVMFVSYWFGCWFLPALLTYLEFDCVKCGKPARKEMLSPEPKLTATDSTGNDSPMGSDDDSPVQTNEHVVHFEEEEEENDDDEMPIQITPPSLTNTGNAPIDVSRPDPPEV